MKRSPARKAARPAAKRRRPQPTPRRAAVAPPVPFPTCDGRPWVDASAAGANGRSKREVLEACHRINQAYARLLALRRAPGFQSPDPREFPLLRAIEAAILARERLEDGHAARGLVATLVYRDGFTVDVRFSDVHSAQSRSATLVTRSSSICLTFALPAGVRARTCKS